MKPIHIFQFVTKPVCGRYRFTIPSKYISQDEQFKVTAFGKLNREMYQVLVAQADILIVQRLPYTPQLEKVITALNALGKIVIYEIDDDLFNLPPDSTYSKNAPADYSARLRRAVQLCQAVQCSTNSLANVLAEFHPEVTVLENQLDEIPELGAKKTDDAPLVIGYAAGENHGQDWLMIQDAVNNFIRATDRNVEFWIVGDSEIYNSLETDRKKFLPLLPFGEYMQALQLIDISLMPLQENKFNRSKSDVKFLESAASGCAVLASRLVYGETIRHNQTGLLFSSKEEFSAGLRRLTENRALREKLAKSAHDYVSSQRQMAQHKQKWQDFYAQMIGRRDELLEKFRQKLQKAKS